MESCESVTLLVLMLSACVVLVHGQSTSGFISIDCGKPRDYSHVDTITGITYTSDFQFVKAGEIHKVALEYLDYVGMADANDLRSFPNGTRNCYSIEPVKQGRQYLVRASFMYGNYDGLNQLPQFDLYLGVTLWKTMIISNASTYYFTEMIALATSSRLSVCLVKTSSESPPFISALELRPLLSTMYPNYTTTSQSLMLFVRIDVGGTAELRFPSDEYDRIWIPFVPGGSTPLVSPSPLTSPAMPQLFRIPSDVMKTAVTPVAGPCLNLSFQWWPMANPASVRRIYLAAAFLEVEQTSVNEMAAPRKVDVFLDNRHWGYFYHTFGPALDDYHIVYSVIPWSSSDDTFLFSVCKTSASLRPPILNALEIQEVIDINEVETYNTDVDAIMSIQMRFKIQKNWGGDPCSPKILIWDGLECNYDNNPRIIALNLSLSGLNGDIPNSLANLTQLQRLDLSRNNLTGLIPDFLGSLPELTYLNLEENRLSGPIPKSLSDRSADGSLSLSLKDNPYFDDSGKGDLCQNSGGCGPWKRSKKKLLIVAIFAPVGSVLVLALILVAIIVTIRRPGRSGEPQEPARSSIRESKSQKPDVLPTEPRQVQPQSLILDSKQFTHGELMLITNNFSVKIGEGGFGSVYHGLLKNGTAVAVKVLPQSSSHGIESFRTEAQVLTSINHKNLVPFVGYCNDIRCIALVYEYMHEGSLEDHFSGKAGSIKALCWKDRVNIAIDAAQGLEYLHKMCRPAIVHRDVKSRNILLTSTLEARISDFGLSKVFPDEHYTHVSTRIMGTLGYLDPEYYTSYRLTEKSDVYSFGVVLLEMITGLPAIAKKPGKIHLVQWVKDKHVSEDIGNIVDEKLPGDYSIRSIKMALETGLSCTKLASIERPTMSEVLISLKECLDLENTRRGSSSAKGNPTGNSAGTSAEIPSGPLEYPTAR